MQRVVLPYTFGMERVNPNCGPFAAVLQYVCAHGNVNLSKMSLIFTKFHRFLALPSHLSNINNLIVNARITSSSLDLAKARLFDRHTMKRYVKKEHKLLTQVSSNSPGDKQK